jgi:ferric-dicitrate binding protein FerR (iron transport regulator)
LSVTSYFKNEEFNDDLKKYLEDDWNETENSGNNQEILNQVLNKLHLKIKLNYTCKTNTLQKFHYLLSKVAVVLLIPALITIAVLSYFSISPSGNADSWAEIHSPVGSRTQFQLPDGTQGWLNSGSSIKYPVNFMKHRNVEISGEVWFDVVHLRSKEFQVNTPYFNVKVLGTRFNVIAYDNETTAEVILEKGIVLVLGKNQEVKEELKPDEHLVYNKSTKEIIKTNIDSKNYTSWKDGLLIFKNVPMSEIAKRLERKYNTEIILHGDSLKSSIFRATFQDENLEEICKMLATVAPIKYKIHKREKQPDNTFAKGKVEMWLRNSINLK